MSIRTFIVAVLLGLPAFAGAQAPAPAAAVPAPVGEVALVTGSVTVAETPPRRLAAGDPIFEGQSVVVATNSYASLKFADGGRVLLRPNTEFTVESFRYKGPAAAPAAPQAGEPATPASVEGTAFFRLVRGGFRAISGLIGKGERQSYRVTTPVATIGIRGTDYEVQLCADDCPLPAQASAGGTQVAALDLAGLELAQAAPGAGGGVIVATHEGSIEVRPPTGTAVFRVDAGQVGLMLASGQTFMLPVVPDALLVNPAPSPKACE